MTEPDVSSSDPTQLETTAVLEGEEWVINGKKWFTSGAWSSLHDGNVQNRGGRSKPWSQYDYCANR